MRADERTASTTAWHESPALRLSSPFGTSPGAYHLLGVGFEAAAAWAEQERLEIASVLEDTVSQLGVGCSVRSRVKSEASTFSKMYRDHLRLDQVHDLVGVRIIVERVASCYAIALSAFEHWNGNVARYKDYICSPKPNGYQSLHMCPTTHTGAVFELQVRTWEMHERSERGSAAHWRYKRHLLPLLATPRLQLPPRPRRASAPPRTLATASVERFQDAS